MNAAAFDVSFDETVGCKTMGAFLAPMSSGDSI
jgi:hypothetical protein